MNTPRRTLKIASGKQIFRGNRNPHEVAARDWPAAPPWRIFNNRDAESRGAGHRSGDDEIAAVNAAIYLRRPLLITGKPGTGKTSLAHAVAHELQLGDVLLWSITSRSTLQQGQYEYDAIARLQDASLPGQTEDRRRQPSDIGRYIRLGPLGAAFRDSKPGHPRLLLIDEIDKSDLDLPNDLLHIFEEGRFEIPELTRLSDEPENRVVEVNMPKGAGKVQIERGVVQCEEFPIVFLTSNGERDFPPAFLRRCVRLDILEPDLDALTAIVRNRFDAATAEDPRVRKLVKDFLDKRDKERRQLATDQLLNAIHLLGAGINVDEGDGLGTIVLRDLSEPGQ